MLESLFGPSKEEMWRQLSQELNDAEFSKGSFWTGTRDRVDISYKNWEITLDTHVIHHGKHAVTYTRIRSPFLNKDGFRFRIFRKKIFSDIAKFFGMQDIVVGYEDFDQDFIIQGNDEVKVKKLFANPNIRALINVRRDISFWVRDDEGFWGKTYPEGVDVLVFQVVGVIKDIERLKTLYALFAETLNQLCAMDSAYENDPNFDV
jgi:hypothetical protein